MDKPWNWRFISNVNLTMEFINNHPNKKWNWKNISLNPNITLHDILNNQDKPTGIIFKSKHNN